MNIKVPGRVNIHYISDYILEKEMEGYVCLGGKGCIVLRGGRSRAATIISIDRTSNAQLRAGIMLAQETRTITLKNILAQNPKSTQAVC